MNDFQYKNGEFCCEDVPLAGIARRVGTPFYVYSSKTLVNHFRAFDAAFAGVPRLICYALKSNSNGAVLRLLGREGAGADIVSGVRARASRSSLAKRLSSALFYRVLNAISTYKITPDSPDFRWRVRKEAKEISW